MNRSNTYLSAAIIVLKSAKRPIHYEKIAIIIRKRRLLDFTPTNFSIGINSILNKECRNNPNGSIVKKRKGVFMHRSIQNDNQQ